MTETRKRRGKHIPQRTCVGCRSVESKRTLIRIVRTPEGLRIDETGKLAGRGAYLHDRKSCWERGLKGSLAAALKAEISKDDLTRLRQYMETLPDEDHEPDSGSRRAAEKRRSRRTSASRSRAGRRAALMVQGMSGMEARSRAAPPAVAE
ncbi:MAG TPA: YlxR family protein [Anaerolineales bacterium]|nr:YlxR family protein [Anaerolineales bacterium]